MVRPNNHQTSGPDEILSPEEERELAAWFSGMAAPVLFSVETEDSYVADTLPYRRSTPRSARWREGCAMARRGRVPELPLPEKKNSGRLPQTIVGENFEEQSS